MCSICFHYTFLNEGQLFTIVDLYLDMKAHEAEIFILLEKPKNERHCTYIICSSYGSRAPNSGVSLIKGA